MTCAEISQAPDGRVADMRAVLKDWGLSASDIDNLVKMGSNRVFADFDNR